MKLFASSLLLAVCALAAPAFAAMPAQPSLKITTLDGKPYDLATQRGHWVIVNFWATWCAPCIKELPDISKFVATHPNVSAIGIAYDDTDPADIRTFLQKHPVSFPVAQVTMDKPLKDFDTPLGLPTTWLIGPDGKVAKHFTGPIKPAMLSAAIGR
ncbi:TlpA family protein disulfide reductase [Dyella acidiphila]|uniref:TlpA family protein disulfide reductase n=1 Tax=Dyella acidiphila TaxID=2775866 RepID=A0ABR9G3Y6_9GAMM|nr:TlpA disulfide reductase family protein [Dyella acidiphila]MBE1158763.1 TlpA family protein disulfide reductase [Dyella acidiphila]